MFYTVEKRESWAFIWCIICWELERGKNAGTKLQVRIVSFGCTVGTSQPNFDFLYTRP